MRPVPRPVLLLVVVHAALLACYTLPATGVPEPARALATAYARGLFHQQWQLFAPDPPLCSCHLEWRSSAGDWTDPLPATTHYLARRMLRSAAWNVQRELAGGADAPSAPLQQALHRLGAHHVPHATGLRLVEHCVTDPARPAEREPRITPLPLP
ncbi:MAG: hypothetical protein R2817_14295 [Flavobacteriales bacterium]